MRMEKGRWWVEWEVRRARRISTVAFSIHAFVSPKDTAVNSGADTLQVPAELSQTLKQRLVQQTIFKSTLCQVSCQLYFSFHFPIVAKYP